MQWGNYVPYSVVESSALKSIRRLVSKNGWPGKEPLVLKTNNDDLDHLAGSENWDYVPDGLLVWEAWNEWMQSSN